MYRIRGGLSFHPVPAHGSLVRVLLTRLSYSSPLPSQDHLDPRLGFVREELEGIQGPRLKPLPALRGEEPERGRRPEAVEITHPWPEWVELMERLLAKGYLDGSAISSSLLNGSKDSNHIRTACLNFARDRVDLIRFFSRRDVQVVVGSGCPSLDRKVVNSGKRLRAHVGIVEGDVCCSCNLRGSCERAYVKAREDEGGRTVDVMRILLTYGIAVTPGSLENQACVSKNVKESVRRLLSEMVDLSTKELDSTTNLKVGYARPKGQINIPMKQGDWICPRCNFLNFAKNVKCLRCNGLFQERLKKLQEEHEHLPLKKGDWICEKCNFLNFAKNTKCLQCHEKPPQRHLNPGEWECPSCNYINFKRNMVCLKCDWKRPKASSSEDVTAESQHHNLRNAKPSSFSFVRDTDDKNAKHFVPLKTEDEDSDFWSSEEDKGCNDDDINTNDFDGKFSEFEFDNFPIVGGSSAISRDALAKERWKGEMSKRSREVSVGTIKQSADSSCYRSFRSSIELDESSDEDDIAGWFRCKTGNDSR